MCERVPISRLCHLPPSTVGFGCPLVSLPAIPLSCSKPARLLRSFQEPWLSQQSIKQTVRTVTISLQATLYRSPAFERGFMAKIVGGLFGAVILCGCGITNKVDALSTLDAARIRYKR